MNYTIESYGATDAGRRRKEKENEDSLYNNPDRRVFVVADGLGGHKNGALASRTAAERAGETLSSYMEGYKNHYNIMSADSPEEKIKGLIKQINMELYDENFKREGRVSDISSYMGTTLSIAALTDNRIYLGYAGNSRIYIVRNGNLERNNMTEEDSPVLNIIEGYEDAGLQKVDFNDEDKKTKDFITHSRKNILGKALGINESIEPSFTSISIEGVEGILLCTDGLTDNVTPREILKIMEDYKPQEAVERFIKLANEPEDMERIVEEVCAEKDLSDDKISSIKDGYKGNDNITAIAVRIFEENNGGK
ncbi:MAG: PP2C family serine/threonine-protein phosphatase [Candidatus Woesearchaeota archaeon]